MGSGCARANDPVLIANTGIGMLPEATMHTQWGTVPIPMMRSPAAGLRTGCALRRGHLLGDCADLAARKLRIVADAPQRVVQRLMCPPKAWPPA